MFKAKIKQAAPGNISGHAHGSFTCFSLGRVGEAILVSTHSVLYLSSEFQTLIIGEVSVDTGANTNTNAMAPAGGRYGIYIKIP